MKERKNKILFLLVIVDLVFWGLLIDLKTSGAVDIHWVLVLSGFLWIAWLMAVIVAMVAVIIFLIEETKSWYRRRKIDRRIIRQAKAAGVWNKRPTPLGGRALELKAWEDFKIKRKPGETDEQLRRRCMNEADKELSNSTW